MCTIIIIARSTGFLVPMTILMVVLVVVLMVVISLHPAMVLLLLLLVLARPMVILENHGEAREAEAMEVMILCL